jgi:hypothetical protein
MTVNASAYLVFNVADRRLQWRRTEPTKRDGLTLIGSYTTAGNVFTADSRKEHPITKVTLLQALKTLPDCPKTVVVNGLYEVLDGTQLSTEQTSIAYTICDTILEGLLKFWSSAFFGEVFKIIYSSLIIGHNSIATAFYLSAPWAIIGLCCMLIAILFKYLRTKPPAGWGEDGVSTARLGNDAFCQKTE